MEDRILESTKSILVGLDDDDPQVDLEILTEINGAFAVLQQLGLATIYVDDATTYPSLNLDPSLLAMVRAYVPLRVKMVFDPPEVGFAIDMKERQLREYEWRICSFLELEAS